MKSTKHNIQLCLRAGLLLMPVLGLTGATYPTHAAPKSNKPAPASKKPTPPKAKAPVVLGQNQMAGENAQFGTTYTMGKDSPLNFTLNSAEYSIDAVSYDDYTEVPDKDQKALVLHYTAHNPMKSEQHFYWSSLAFTVVDALDNNHEGLRLAAREGSRESVALSLKPAQKIDVWTAILVPARVALPKLIVASEETGQPVLRYDLRGKVKGIAAPYADATGMLVATDVPAKADALNPLGKFATRLESTSYTKEALNEYEPEEGKRYFVATFAMQNATNAEQNYDASTFSPTLIDGDGEKVEYNGAMLKAKRNEAAAGTLKPSESVSVRFFFALPENVAGKTIWMREGDQGRTFIFDVPAAPTP